MENTVLDNNKALGNYGPCVFDGASGEPIGWGYKITQRVGEEEFNKLREYGKLEYIMTSYTSGYWVVVTKQLTREEAIEKYGEISHEEIGPRGGWKHVVFGVTKFTSKYLRKV